jgi:hypothetical protein
VKVPQFTKLHVHLDELTMDVTRRHTVALDRSAKVKTIAKICAAKFSDQDLVQREVYSFGQRGEPLLLKRDDLLIDLNFPKRSTVVLAREQPASLWSH